MPLLSYVVTKKKQHNIEKCRHTCVRPAGFGTTIAVFERWKTARALDREAIGTGTKKLGP